MLTRKEKNKKQSRNLPKTKLTFHKLDKLEWFSVGIGLWFLLIANPYKILFVVLMALPIIGLIANGLYGRPSITSLIEITKDKGEDKYDVADFIDFPALAICIRILRDFEFESVYSLIIPGTITFIAMCVLLWITHEVIIKSTKNKSWIYFSLLGNLFLYSYAGTYGVNCLFDDSETQYYPAKVLDKTISRSRRSSTYYVKVAAWGHHHDPEKISVASSQYETIQIGETVIIDYHEGLLGIPWYEIE